MREIPEGEVVVATHNQDTIEEAISIKQKYPHSPVVSFAQLLGLADHLTCQLPNPNPRTMAIPSANTNQVSILTMELLTLITELLSGAIDAGSILL